MALVGISTALLVNMLGQARIWTMAAREHLIPLFWARVSPRFGTPIAAQVTMGAASGQWQLIQLLMALQQARQHFTLTLHAVEAHRAQHLHALQSDRRLPAHSGTRV